MHKIRYIRDHQLDPVRYGLYLRAIWIAIIGNGLLVIAKGSAALLTGSTAVLATAVDSITDVIYTLFLAWGLRLSQQPADESHPQGHARVEPLVSVLVGLMMGVAGFEVIKRALSQLFGVAYAFEWGFASVVLVGSGLIKIAMFLLVNRLGKAAHSPAIAATARDNLADVFSAVTALVGVLAANWLHPLADPVAGIIVSLWIFRNAFTILTENLGYLTGRAAEPELLRKIHAAARSVSGVRNVHQVIADYVGPQLRADLHVDVDDKIPFSLAHQISDQVREVVEALDEVDQAFVHLEPYSIHQEN